MDKSDIFIGRQAELRALTESFEKILKGQPQLIFVSGEAGIGKSYLLLEFLERTLSNHAELVSAVANCNASFGKSDPLLPWRSIAEQLLNPKKNKIRSISNLTKTAGEFVLEVAPDALGIFFPVIGPIVSILTKAAKTASNISKAPKPDDNMLSKRSMVFEQFSQLLFRFSKKSPIVIVLEDMQWADESTIELLFHLARSWENQRILIVATYRDEDMAIQVKGHPLLMVEREMLIRDYCQKIHLEWLDKPEVETWLSNLFQKNKIPDDFSKWLLSRTEGNPLFIAEILQDMQEKNALLKDDNGYWVLSKTITGPEDLPKSIDALIELRLARLEQKLIETLTCASVEGDEFTAEVVSTIRKADLAQVLDELIDILGLQYGLISMKEERKLTEQRILSLFKFRHSLIQTYLYKKLDPIRKRRFHLSVGDCLEEIYGEQSTQIAPSLARHFAEGKDMQRAYKYAQISAKLSENLFDYSAAREWINKSLEYANSLDLSASEISVLKHALGRAESRVGSFSNAILLLSQALELIKNTDNKSLRPLILMDLGYCFIQTNRSQEAIKAYKDALDIFQVENSTVQVAHCMSQLAFAYHKNEQQQLAKTTLLKAEELFELSNNVIGLAYVNRHLGINYRIENDFENSVKYLDAAARFDAKTGNRFDEASDYTNLGSTYLMLRNDYGRAFEYYQKSLNLSRDISNVHEEGHVLLNMARLCALQEKWTDALEFADEGLRLSELVSDDANITRGLSYRGVIKYRLGSIESGLKDYQRLLEYSSSEVRELWGMLYNYASLLLAHGNQDAAFNSYFDAAKVLLKTIDNLPVKEKISIISSQGKINVFVAVLTSAPQNHARAISIIERLPKEIQVDSNVEYPKIYWGSGKWV
ncbi:MAG: AAA family ATPase [Anaerolineales bacterium]|nr:AAA family ATPase [Anaerolineales bacterium]